MSVLILPVAVVVAMFSYEIMLIWTQNQITAEKSHVLVSILISGTALNGLMNIPYGLQLAHGWTRLALSGNLIAIIILAPMIVFMTSEYGVLGGASVWVILNGGYVLISIHFMHRRLLTREKWNWYWHDVSLPLIASLLIPSLGRIFISSHISQFMMIIYLIIISFLTLTITAITTKTTRTWFFNKIIKLKLAYGE